ncbi:MAG: sulfatase [bacterium]|nr:sulfatase [bacterium]
MFISEIASTAASDRKRRIALALALVAVVGCPPGPEYEVVHDLVESFPVAEVRRETPLIDLGAASARRHLVRGWSWDEVTAEGMTYVWATGESSVVEFFMADARDLRATFRCFPFTFAGALRQTVSVALNDREVTAIALDASPREYELTLPAAAMVAGPNRLTLRYAYHRQPSEVTGTGDSRHLAVGWDFIRFDLEPPSAEPLARSDEPPGRLLVPFGTEIAYYFEVPGDSFLHFEDLTVGGDGKGRLAVLWQADGRAEEQLASLSRGSGAWKAKLPGTEPRVARITLRAVEPGGDGRSRQGVVVTAPTLRARGRSRRPDDAASTTVTAAPGTPATAERSSENEPANVLIYLVDALRADRLGCYGHTVPALSPRIDALAAEGILFEHAMAQASWTKPSVASVLTGLRPVFHGVNDPRVGLAEATTTLAELLQTRGYRTAAFVTNWHITAASGFDQGFEHFDFSPDLSDEVTRKVLAWFDENERPNPFFLYVHTVDPHAAYDPTEEFRQRFAAEVGDPEVGTFDHIRALGKKEILVTPELVADLLRLYDAEVAQNDHFFGLLLDGLRERGLYENTLIVFLSDHGDAFHEHGIFGHGWDLYNEVLEVPLVLRPPRGRDAVRISETVQHIDVFPTILDFLGMPIPSRTQGRSLLDAAATSGTDPPPAFSYMNCQGREGISVVYGDWKFIELGPGWELYERRQDRFEKDNLTARYPILAGYLASLARDEMLHLGEGLSAEPVELDEVTRRGLEALGYLN